MKGHAILVGVNKVDSTKYGIGNDISLNPALHNVNLLCEQLEKLDFFKGRIYTLTDENASWTKLKGTLQTVKNGNENNNFLLIYYSGHGYKPKGELAAYFKSTTELYTFYDTVCFDIEVINSLKILGEGFNICLVFDSCYSGGLSNDMEHFERILLSYKLKKKYIHNVHSILRLKSDNFLKKYIKELLSRYTLSQANSIEIVENNIWLFSSSGSDNKIPITNNESPTPYTQMVCLFTGDNSYDGNHYHLGELLKRYLPKKYNTISGMLSGGRHYFTKRVPLNLDKLANLKTKYNMNWNIVINQTHNQPVEVTLNPEPNQFKIESIQAFEVGVDHIHPHLLDFAQRAFPDNKTLKYIRSINVVNTTSPNVIVDKNDSPLISKDIDNDITTNGMIVIFHNDNYVAMGGIPIKGEVDNPIGN